MIKIDDKGIVIQGMLVELLNDACNIIMRLQEQVDKQKDNPIKVLEEITKALAGRKTIRKNKEKH